MIKIYQGCNKILNGKIYFDKEKTHIYEVDGAIAGYFNLTPMLNSINIDYELLEEFREIGMGNKFLEYISEYTGKKYSEYEKILLLIEYNNIKSKKIALKNGYEEDFFLFENDDCELHNTHVFTKKNEYYKKGL